MCQRNQFPGRSPIPLAFTVDDHKAAPFMMSVSTVSAALVARLAQDDSLGVPPQLSSQSDVALTSPGILHLRRYASIARSTQAWASSLVSSPGREDKGTRM